MKANNIPWNPQFYQEFTWFRDLYPINYPAFSEDTWPSVAAYNEYCYARRREITNTNQSTIKFIPQYQKSSEFEHQYEPLIYRQGKVLTREKNWHDFFNMLVWTSFPLTKATINAQQYQQLHQRYQQAHDKRTPLENGLTLFDENGVIILSTCRDLLTDIQQHRWKTLFWDKREQLNKLIVIVFGHAIYEKLLTPYLSMTGHSVLFHISEPLGISGTDQLLHDYLNQVSLTSNNLQPFPLMGMPGCYPGSDVASFYDNEAVFRPRSS